MVTLAFFALIVDSHRQFPRLTREDKLTPQVLAGKDVWHKNNCTNCHTLLGEVAYYAPDLTKIATQRGAGYLKAFLHDPSQFYDEQKVRRAMPKPNLSDQEIDDVISTGSRTSTPRAGRHGPSSSRAPRSRAPI